MKIITIVLSDRDQEMLDRLQGAGRDPRPLIESLVTSALKEAVRDRVEDQDGSIPTRVPPPEWG